MGAATPTAIPGGLLHPGWLLGLGLLIVNDHLLKSLPGAPEALTGKLSDFAGLVVAPVLLATLLGGGRVARKLAFVSTGLVFALINLSAAAAAAFDAALGAIGVPWQTFVDPTDLAAFAVYPFAWRCSAPSRRAGPPWARRGLAAVGLLACAASSPPVTWMTSAYIVNHTDGDVQVRLRYPEASIDCTVQGRLQRAIDPQIFGPGVSTLLSPDETLALDQQQILASPDAAADGIAGPMTGCQAVLVSIEGREEQLVFYNDLPRLSVELSLGDVPDTHAHAVLRLHDERRALLIEVGSGLMTAPLLDEVGPDQCDDGRSQAFGFSALSGRFEGVLTSLEAGVDGCARLGFESREAPFFLCVPLAELPFAPGDVLGLSELPTEDGRALQIVRDGLRPRSVTVYNEVSSVRIGTEEARFVDRDCDGGRLECGGFMLRGAVEIGRGVRLVPGVAADLWLDYKPEPLRVRLGRAERLLVGREACGAGQAEPGTRIDLMIIDEG